MAIISEVSRECRGVGGMMEGQSARSSHGHTWLHGEEVRNCCQPGRGAKVTVTFALLGEVAMPNGSRRKSRKGGPFVGGWLTQVR